MYMFSRRTRGTLGCYHGMDVAYVHGTSVLGPSGPEDKQLARDMAQFWTSFAKTGDPNSHAGSLPTWPRFTRQHQELMEINYTSRAVPCARAAKFDVLDVHLRTILDGMDELDATRRRASRL